GGEGGGGGRGGGGHRLGGGRREGGGPFQGADVRCRVGRLHGGRQGRAALVARGGGPLGHRDRQEDAGRRQGERVRQRLRHRDQQQFRHVLPGRQAAGPPAH